MKDFTTSHQASSKASIISANYVKHHGLNIAVVLHSKGFSPHPRWIPRPRQTHCSLPSRLAPHYNPHLWKANRRSLETKAISGEKAPQPIAPKPNCKTVVRIQTECDFCIWRVFSTLLSTQLEKGTPSSCMKSLTNSNPCGKNTHGGAILKLSLPENRPIKPN